jgi:hypothetical protein
MTGCRTAVLTGAAGAAKLGLDGFRDIEWPALWCSPSTTRRQEGLIRTSKWMQPVLVDDQRVAHPVLILRHIGEQMKVLGSQPDRLKALARIEYAVEHCLREGFVTLEDLHEPHGRGAGDQLLRELLYLRGDEPAAESYAEVSAIQLLRSWGLHCWRQLAVTENGRIKHRVDFVIPFDQTRCRPTQLQPNDGLLLEVDSHEFHVGRFEEDHQRQTTYDLLGFRWTTVTPNQLRDSPNRVRRAIEVRLVC